MDEHLNRVKDTKKLTEEELTQAQENFDILFDSEYIGNEISDFIEARDFNDSAKEYFQKLRDSREELVTAFIRSELREILLSLGMLTDFSFAEKLLFVIGDDEESPYIVKVDGYYHVVLPWLDILHLLQLNSAADKVKVIQALAHEFFHVYIDEKYPSTSKKTKYANLQAKKGDRSEYDKDRGEIACDLFSLHILRKKLTALQEGERLPDDGGMIKALEQEIDLLAREVRNALEVGSKA